MLISSLVITLHDAPELRAEALAALQAQSKIELGEVNACWLPAVMEADDDREAHALHDWIAMLPGVAFVDVAAVHFEEPATAPAHVH